MMRITILRTNGTQEVHDVPRGDLSAVRALIGCETVDTVTLSADGAGARRIMIVDDAGWDYDVIDHGHGRFEHRPTRPRKPINDEATTLYRSVCRPGVTHQIVGDVAIADDRDFE